MRATRTFNGPCQKAEFDPMYGPAVRVQEDFVDLGDAALHQCIRSLIGALIVAPDHHGYQRACDVISG